MNRLLFTDLESLSRAAALKILQTTSEKPKATICLATGATPTRTYQILDELTRADRSCFSDIRIVKLDEWGGLADNDPATCEYYWRKYIVDPLQISAGNYISFQSGARDARSECARVRTELASIKAIDLCILGLGKNGHLGFNEPSGVLQPQAHVIELSEQTRQHEMIQHCPIKPAYGYTLGMADLLQARKIILLVSGSHKTAQLAKLMQGKIETSFPASFLWLHADVDLYCDIE